MLNTGIKKLFLMLVILTCFSCKETVEVVPLKDIIDFSVKDYDRLKAAKLIRADGVMQIKLIARLPVGADVNFRTVKFKASEGTFDVAETDKTECKVLAVAGADPDKLEASTYLTLGKTSGNYTISAAIDGKADYKSELIVEVLPLNVSDFIAMEIEDYDRLVAEAKLKADGLTRIKLTAFVPLATVDVDKQIEFKTSLGSFDVANEAKLSKTVTAVLQKETDTKLSASAYLTLGTTPGNYTVSVNIKGKENYQAEKTITVLPMKVSDVLQLSLEPASVVRADGISVLTAMASVTNITAQKVIISTTDGAIINSADPKSRELELNGEGKAQASITVGTDVKNYLITAKIPGSTFELSKAFSVARAYPDNFVVEPSSLLADTAGTGITLTVFLKRAVGKVSVGTAVAAKAYQVMDNNKMVSVGRFTGTNNTSDGDGKLALEFFIDSGGVLKNKPVVVEVSAQRDNGAFITKKLELKVK